MPESAWRYTNVRLGYHITSIACLSSVLVRPDDELMLDHMCNRSDQVSGEISHFTYPDATDAVAGMH